MLISYLNWLTFLHYLINFPVVVNKVCRKTGLLVTVSCIMVFYLKIQHTKFVLFVTVITTPRFQR